MSVHPNDLSRLTPSTRLLRLFLASLVAFLAGCTTIPPAGQRADLRRAETLLRDGDARSAVTMGEALLQQGDLAPPVISQAHLVTAEAHLALGHYEEALTHFRAASAGAHTPELQERIAVGLGNTHYRQRHFLPALRQYEVALRLPLSSACRQEVSYRLAICSKAQGRRVEAQRYLAQAGGYRPDPRDPLRWEVLDWGQAAPSVPPPIARPRWTPPSRPSPAPVQTPVRPSSVSDIPPADSSPPRILPRSAWDARSPRRGLATLGRVDLVTVHHTAGRTTDDGQSASARTIAGIQRHHQKVNGWADIAYHYVVDRGGRIWEGRSIRYRGAHAGDTRANRGNVGVVLLGNFEEQRPSPAQLQGLAHLLDWLRQRYALGLDDILTHREVKQRFRLAGTVCPGAHLQSFMTRLRDARGHGRPGTGAALAYRVLKGDTLFSIGRRFQVSPGALERANPGLTAGSLQAGMTLQIPR